MRIGIATITAARNDNFNYGNILQNYALTKFLKSKGHCVETIYYQSSIPPFNVPQKKHRLKEKPLQFMDDVVRVIKRTIFKKKLKKKTECRNSSFHEFINANIKYTMETYTADSDFSKLNNQFDYFIVGSDQVWNPYWEGSNEFYYLPFAEKCKRIAYAPSFGIGYVPDVIKDDIGKWLNNFEDITIREEEGRQILVNLYGKNASIVCDPVFLLSDKEWFELCSDINEQSFFAVYILGKKTVETKKMINKFKKMSGCKPIDLYCRDDLNSKFCSPIEFLSYLKEAKFILTDSFHAVAFSIIFNIPVVIVDRNANDKKSTYKMNGRIDQILGLVGLKNREAEKIISGESELMSKIEYNKSELNELIDYSKRILQEKLKKRYE